MAGSILALILIPIAAMLALAFWIFMIFYADSHPVGTAGITPRDSGDHGTRPQGVYLTQPESRLPRQERSRADAASAAAGGAQAAGTEAHADATTELRVSERVPGQRETEPGQAERVRSP